MRKVLVALVLMVLVASVLMSQTVVVGAEPNIVATKTILGGTGAITKVAWVTLPAGWYDLECSGNLAVAGTSASIDLAMYWFQPQGSEITMTPACRLGGASGAAYGSGGGSQYSQKFRVKIKANTAVSYAVTTTSTGTYDYYMSIKRVQ